MSFILKKILRKVFLLFFFLNILGSNRKFDEEILELSPEFKKMKFSQTPPPQETLILINISSNKCNISNSS